MDHDSLKIEVHVYIHDDRDNQKVVDRIHALTKTLHDSTIKLEKAMKNQKENTQ